MSIANEISKLQQNLLDCYDVCADNGAYLPEDINFDNLANCIEQISNPFNKPADWSDIRKDCPANSIALYAGHTADYSQYDNLGFTATCEGGYKVFIDGTQYGTTYASGATCTITWSTSGITTGDDITTPSAMKAHKIWIQPATEGNNITAFHCTRVAASGLEQQGILWAHFNIDNQLGSIPAFGDETNRFRNTLLTSITAKNNKLRVSNLYYAFYYCTSLEYTPEFILPSSFSYYLSGAFAQTSISKITLKDTSLITTRQSFQNCQNLKKITLKNVDLSGLKRADNFIKNAKSLEDTILDVSNATGLTVIGCYGTSQYFMSGFKGLRVSNEAPFNNATPPQINVSYTGMDRSALVQLFNDLPYNVGYTVVGSPTIQDGVVSGFSTSDYVKASSLPDFSGDCEIVIPFNVADLSSTQYLMSWLVSGFSCGIMITTQGKINIYFSRSGDSSTTLSIAGNHTYSTNTNNKMKLVKEGNTLSLYYWDNGWVFDKSSTNENAGIITVASYFRIGVSSNYNSKYPLNGSIDLNETYIKVNDVYWFRGQPTMTKTLSCVGATGTADLTAEDKDIALNKGWSITIS